MASSILLKFPRNTEIQTKQTDVGEALSRVRRPLDSTRLKFSVFGIYALPEVWKAKFDEGGNESQYAYEIELLGVHMQNSKVLMKELTEEEKAELEAKNIKGKPAAQPKGKGQKEEEPSAEELERLEKERLAKEEREAKLKAEWEALSEEERFYRTSEDIFKEPCIKMRDLVQQQKVDELQEQLTALGEPTEENQAQRTAIQNQIGEIKTDIGLSICEKQGFELIELEEAVRHDGGAWLKFMKLPQVEQQQDEKAAAKKAPAKKGAQSAEELKPVFGKAWVNLSELKKPGAKFLEQRVSIQTIAPAIKESHDGVDSWVDQEEFEEVFEPQKTYIHLQIEISDPVVPTVPDKPEPKPHEVVPEKQLIKWPFSKTATDDFCKQVAIAIKALTREYYTLFQVDLEKQANITMSAQETAEAYEERKKEFLYEINQSGKYHILKEKMKKTIVRIVKETYQKHGSIKGLSKNSQDHFYSELYIFLVGQMRGTVKEMVQCEKDELHENVSIPEPQAERERDHLIEKHIGETKGSRDRRLAYEEEYLNNNPAKAEKYLSKLMAADEGNAVQMLEMAKFYLRQKDLDKAEQFLRDAYSFDLSDKATALQYACLLCQLNRSQEASVILKQLISDGYEPVKVNMLLSIAYGMDGDTFMAEKYKAISNLMQLRSLGRQQFQC